MIYLFCGIICWILIGFVFSLFAYKWLKGTWGPSDGDLICCIIFWFIPMSHLILQKPFNTMIEFIKFYNKDENE